MKRTYDDREIEEFFTYRAPTTQERKDAHKLVGQMCLDVCIELLGSDDEGDNERIYSGFRDRLTAMTKNSICQKWMTKSFDDLLLAVRARSEECILMNVQQLRMFVNQGITMDEKS